MTTIVHAGCLVLGCWRLRRAEDQVVIAELHLVSPREAPGEKSDRIAATALHLDPRMTQWYTHFMSGDETTRRLIDHLSSHPPRCVNGFELHPAHLDGVVFDGHGEELNTVFSVGCSCGHNEHFILGHHWRNPEYSDAGVFVGPLALRCEACEKVTELIDTDVHGYDSELGHGSTTVRGEGERNAFACDECGMQPFTVYVRFEYPDDLFTDDFDDCRGREQDLFTWFSLVGTCCGCSRLRQVADFECA